MNPVSPHCPRCGSARIASRRQLFHELMDAPPLQGAFSWYNGQVPRAYPPKSMFVMLLALTLGVTLPVTGLWLLGYHLALQWLAIFALLLLVSLLLDLTLTYRQYRTWGDEWLCGECRAVFTHEGVIFPRI